MKFCPNCGKKIKNNVVFCPYCGYQMNNVQQITNHHSYHIIIVLLIIMIMICIGGFIEYPQYARNNYGMGLFQPHLKGFHYLHGTGRYGYFNNNIDTSNFWTNPQDPHEVLVKHNVPAKNISVKGVSDAGAYSIGKQMLRRGTVIKGYYPPSGPGGFYIERIEHNNGFHLNQSYENRHEANWSVNPPQGLFSNYWMEAIK